MAQAFVRPLVRVSAFASTDVRIGLGGTVPGVNRAGYGGCGVRWDGRGDRGNGWTPTRLLNSFALAIY